MLLTMPDRNFEAVRNDLQDVVSRLKATFDPEVRHELLRELRLLLEEADRLVSTTWRE